MLLNLILIVVLGICFITDLKYQRIYNKVIFPALASALLLQVFYFGIGGILGFLTGFLAGFGILLIPYFLGGIGAGDVKLLALIGAVKGSLFVLNTAVYMAVIGGIIALFLLMFHVESIKFFKEFALWIISLFYGVRSMPKFPSSPFLKKYPYGVAIVGGALICLIFKGAWLV